MKHPTSRNRVQRQAELYSKRYSIDVTVAENNSSSSGEEVLLKNRNVGGILFHRDISVYLELSTLKYKMHPFLNSGLFSQR